MSAGLRTNYSDGGAAASATEIVASDMNAISQWVNSLAASSTSTAASATTLTLTAASDPIQIITGTTQAQTVALASTAVLEGNQWMVINQLTGANVTVTASGGATIAVIPPGAAAIFTATAAAPTTAAGWLAQQNSAFADGSFTLYDNADPSKVLAIDVSTITASTTRTVAAPDISGALHAEAIITSTATRTLTSQTAAQKIFGTPTNGAVTLSPGTYFFDCFFTLSSMSSTSGSFGFALTGTATIAAQLWQTEGNKATLATAAAAQNTMNTTANTTIVTATTGTVGWAHIWGKVRISAGGTLIPEVSLGVAAAAVVGADSFFRIWPIGSASMTSVGPWT